MQPDDANSLSSLACLLIARSKGGEVMGSENSGRSVDETESGPSAAAPKHLIEAEDLLRRAVCLAPSACSHPCLRWQSANVTSIWDRL